MEVVLNSYFPKNIDVFSTGKPSAHFSWKTTKHAVLKYRLTASIDADTKQHALPVGYSVCITWSPQHRLLSAFWELSVIL